jgi:hypothetical protein
MPKKIEFGQDGNVLSLDCGRGSRHTRTNNVRVTRGQKKVARGIIPREGGEGKLAPKTMIPRGIRVSTPANFGWREANQKASEKLAHAE